MKRRRIKSNLRKNNLFKTFPSLTSPRVNYLLSKGINPNDGFSGEEHDKLKSFSKGYNLEGIMKTSDVNVLCETKGIDYAEGIIRRFEDEVWVIKYFTKLNSCYKNALEFKEEFYKN